MGNLRVAIIVAVCAASVPGLFAQTYSTGFEPPVFTLGDVNGQNGWGHISNSPTDGFIELNPIGTPASLGTQSLAIRTREVAFFGVSNHLFSATIDPPAGETGSTVGGVVVPAPLNTFHASLWYRTPTAPVVSTRADGRIAELDPSSKGSAPGDVANRYAVVRVYNDGVTGLVRVEISTLTNNGNNGYVSVAANNLQWGTWYRFDYLIALVDGTNGVDPNDRFRLTIFDTNGVQVGVACGSTWEAGWKSGTFGGGATARAINGFDFWSTTGPNGTLVGNVDDFSITAQSTAMTPLSATIAGNANACAGGTTTLSVNNAGGTGPLTSVTWRDAANAIVGSGPTFNAAAGTYTATITDSFCETVTSAPFTVGTFAPVSIAITGNTNVCFGATTTVTASASGGSGTISSYTWRDASNAVVSNTASLTAGAGTYTVTATDASCGNSTASVTILTTCKATPIVTWNNPADIVYGTPLSGTQLNATANVPGTFVYTPPAGTVLNAGPNQILSVDFTPADTANYNSVNGTTVRINVLKAPTTTTITNINPSPSLAGGVVTFDVSVTSPNGTPAGIVTISDGTQSCVTDTVTRRCSMTFATPGNYTITATYAGDSNFLGSTSASRTHTVVLAATATVDGSTTLCGGGSATIRVTLTGQGPWTITWSDGITQTVTNSPATRTVTPLGTTSYRVLRVTDQNGTGTASGVAVIVVNIVPAPSILDAPIPVIGQPLTLHATAGYDSYQWFKNGVPIPNATSATLFIASVSSSDLGSYTVAGRRGGCVSNASAAFSLIPVAQQSDDAVIPVVGKVRGFGESLFRTTVTLVNGSDQTIEGEISFINTELPKIPYSLAPHTTRFIENLFPDSFDGLTSANVHRLRGPLPVVIAHVFNDGGDKGNTGMIEGVVPVEETLAAGDVAVLVAPIDPLKTRFNVGLRSLSDGFTVRITRRTAAGQLVVMTERTLPPSTLVHESQLAGSSDSFTFEVLAGRGVIYGSATDNGVNDPNMQIATKVVPAGGVNRYILPVAGSITGAFNSRFATGLQIYNPSENPITATLTFRPANTTLAVTVQPRATYFTNDLIDALHASGLGTVDVVTTASTRPVMLARVYSIGEKGETSFMTELVPESEALTAGGERVIAAPHSVAKSRLNIGVRALSAGAQITATVRNASGAVLKVTQRSFAPDTLEQTPAETMLGVAFTGDESISFHVDQGSAIVYATWTDNVTQDPALQ